MSRVLYISKLNLVSRHIYDAYDDPEILTQILKNLFFAIDDKIEHTRIDTNTVDGEELVTYKASYKFSAIEKSTDFIIVGNLIKTSNLYFNVRKEGTDELQQDETEFSEVIHFCLDVFKEKVAFYTKNRFGYDEFNNAFTRLINEYANLEGDKNYIFETDTIKQASSIKTIQDELNQIGNIKQLKITIKPPNPDDPLLNDIHIDIEEYLKDIKEGNITDTSSLFNSSAPEGLKLNSRIVKAEFGKIEEIHSKLSDEVALANNYVIVEAETKSGRQYSTKKRKPLTIEIKDYQTYGPEFIKVCKNLFSVSSR
ncbi:hypothetical protein [Alkaliphilus transvaalensis]|uniref:hypothetical protein n=1 Tax=Alkaliphilus transvaalensis TaxID=114628 RepID=UPI000687F6C3|nr:hypothetical protein [Alkaliphilus transvaalensis]